MKHKTLSFLLAVLMSMVLNVVCAEKHEYVDLGLPSGTLWATCNVGASEPEGYGNFYAWGETETKSDFSWSNYKWCNGSDNTLTKYNYNSNYGIVDNKMELDPEDDAAFVNWGSGWRMPTQDQRNELKNNCSWTHSTLNGVNGYIVTGPNGNTIFLPQPGWMEGGTEITSRGIYANYASRTLDSSEPRYALALSLKDDRVYTSHNWRCCGRSIRPVRTSTYDVEIDGICYILNEHDATVTCKTTSYNSYSGDIVIPATVSYDGETYDVTAIRSHAFYGCSGLTSIEIPNSVTSIGSDAFKNCTGLEKAEFASIEQICNIERGNNLSNPLYYAHHLYIGGEEVTEVVIPSTVETVKPWAFDGYKGLTSVSISEGVTILGRDAFCDCSELTEATLPSTLTTMEQGAFARTKLKAIVLPDALTSIGKYAFQDCSEMTSLTIGNSVTSIGGSAFSGCKSLTSVTINSNAIASKTYTNSSRLSEIFGSQVTEYTFGRGVETIGANACYGLTGLTSITIPNSVTSIGSYAFSGCTGLTSIEIPNSVTSIGVYAFSGCTNMNEAVMGDNVTSVGANAFPASTSLYANRGTTSLLALWNANYLAPMEKGTENVLTASTLNLEGTTQMTATVSVNDFYPEYENTLNDNVIEENTIVLNVRPEYEETLALKVWKDGVTYTAPNLTYTTLPISPTATRAEGTASSMAVKASYLEGDAEVTSQTLTVNGVTVEGDSLYLNGLKPNTKYKATYTIMVNDEYEYTGTVDLKTDAMAFVNEQPKVISEGNVIIGATSNLDWEETNVGFQWRRTDWTDDFDSNEAGAYQFEGKIEGYIRNMNTTYLWRFRPYYEAADGTRFYGDWLGIDPTNTSYFEPTVHTYANITVEGNSAEVKGYAQRGTDNVVSQGFVYWISSPKPSPAGREKAPAIPSGAQKVEASGTVMEANLTGLEYETTYKYVAYVTTSEGETFYGEEKMFTTGENPDGIEAIDNGQLTMDNAKGMYDLSGRKMNVNDRSATEGDACLSKNVNYARLKKGIYIVNGKKVLIE